MYLLKCTRSEFLGIFLQNASVKATHVDHTEISEPIGSEIDVYWKDAPSQNYSFPDFIVVNSQFVKDFFAWTFTYIPSHNPITSFLHVVDYNDLILIAKKGNPPKIDFKSKAFTGLILSELHCLNLLKHDKFQTSCSYFYLVSRIFSEGYDGVDFKKIYKKFLALLRFFSLDTINLDGAGYENILDFFSDTSDNRTMLKNIIPSLVESGFNTEIAVEQFDKYSNMNISAKLMLKLPKDQRYVNIRDMLKSPVNYEDHFLLFKMAYFVNLIAPGTLKHLDMLKHIPNKNIYLYYGLCAGLSNNDEIFNLYSNLGRRIFRSITRTHSGIVCPSCDIGLSELLYKYNNSDTLFKSYSTNRIFIEILPLINVEFRDDYDTAKKNNSTKNILNMIDGLAKTIHSIRNEIENSETVSDKSQKTKPSRSRKSTKSNALF